jgi:hypothetical protein
MVSISESRKRKAVTASTGSRSQRPQRRPVKRVVLRSYPSTVKATNLARRRILHLAAGAAVLPAVSRIARAQVYPSQPVRVIVPFAPAGGTDIFARLIGQHLSERLGQQFVIENRPGGNSNIGTEAVVRALPDGYTLLLVDASPAINATFYGKLNFNFIRDIAPVASIASQPMVMVINPSFPAKTVPEFVAYAKANPGKISMASGGTGNPTHVSGELFKIMAGIDMVHIPYRGTGPVLTDLLGEQVQDSPTFLHAANNVRRYPNFQPWAYADLEDRVGRLVMKRDLPIYLPGLA